MVLCLPRVHASAWRADLHSWRHPPHSCQCRHPISTSKTSWVKTNKAECQRGCEPASDHCWDCLQRMSHLTPCPLCSPMTTWTTSLYLSNPKAVEEQTSPVRPSALIFQIERCFRKVKFGGHTFDSGFNALRQRGAQLWDFVRVVAHPRQSLPHSFTDAAFHDGWLKPAIIYSCGWVAGKWLLHKGKTCNFFYLDIKLSGLFRAKQQISTQLWSRSRLYISYAEVQNCEKSVWSHQTTYKWWRESRDHCFQSSGTFHSLVFMIRSYEVCSRPLHPGSPTPQWEELLFTLLIIFLNGYCVWLIHTIERNWECN